MKKIVLLFAVLIGGICSAQELAYQFRSKDSNNEELKYSEIKGSPYLDKNFVKAKATCCNETLPMRYDIYADQIEYQKDGIVYVLLKQSPYFKIEFQNNTTLVLDEIPGTSGLQYSVLLVDGKNSLLKKLGYKIETSSGDMPTLNKNPGAFSANSDKSSNFKAVTPIFYLKTDKGIIELKSKKDLYDLYPNSTSELDKFFDSNKIKFNKEDGLIKLVNFLNTLSK